MTVEEKDKLALEIVAGLHDNSIWSYYKWTGEELPEPGMCWSGESVAYISKKIKVEAIVYIVQRLTEAGILKDATKDP